MAHHLATQTQKPIEQFLRQRRDGKDWSEIARANGMNLGEIDEKLERIENAMRNPTATVNNDYNNDNRDRGTRSERTAVRERDAVKTDLDRRLDSLNSLDDQPNVMRAGLVALSKETAVPYPQIEELQKQNVSASVGDLFVAQELATKTQKSAREILSQRTGGKSWSQIISDHNMNRSEIEQKLGRIEQAMRSAGN